MERLSVGVDVSKDTLDVAYWEHDEAVYMGQYANNQKGFQAIRRKVGQKREETEAIIVHIVMEPTGGYEQPFAHFVDQQSDWQASLPNPLRVREWSKGMGKRARTDSNAAKTLAHYGHMQKPPAWHPLSQEVEELEHLLNRLEDYQDLLLREKNRLHAYENRSNLHKLAFESHRQTIDFLAEQIKLIQDAIKEHLKTHSHLREQRKHLLTVPGVGEKNVLYILVMLHRWGELTSGQGNAKSLAAYLGLDPTPHESGSSVRKRARISRQGSRKLRSRLYMGALGGMRSKGSPLKTFYVRLVNRGKAKKLALVASARKILVWCWAVFRGNVSFDTARFANIH